MANAILMRSIHVFAFIIITLSGVYGQKCQYISNSVSGMDGTRLVITQPEKFAKNSDEGVVQVWGKLHMDSVIVLSVVLKGTSQVHFARG